MAAIGELKEKINSGKDVNDKEFNKIMMTTGSKQGMDPKKGEKTKATGRTAIDKIKGN